MLIKDLKPKQGNIDLDVQIMEIREVKETISHGKSIKVAKAVIEDGSGKCILTLWNEEITNLKVGDKIRIRNGWCDEWKGEVQVTAGRYGMIEKVLDEEAVAPIIHETKPKKDDHTKQTHFFADAKEYSDDDILTYNSDEDII